MEKIIPLVLGILLAGCANNNKFAKFWGFTEYQLEQHKQWCIDYAHTQFNCLSRTYGGQMYIPELDEWVDREKIRVIE